MGYVVEAAAYVGGTFLIGAEGKIEQIWDNVKVKNHAAEVLAAASK